MGSLWWDGTGDVGNGIDGPNSGEGLGAVLGLRTRVGPDPGADPKVQVALEGQRAGGNPSRAPLGSMGPRVRTRGSRLPKNEVPGLIKKH